MSYRLIILPDGLRVFDVVLTASAILLNVQDKVFIFFPEIAFQQNMLYPS